MRIRTFATLKLSIGGRREREETAGVGVAVTEERKRDAPARNILLY